MSQRLTRKEMLQKDQFVSSMEQTLDYSRSHMRIIVYAIGGALVLALVVGLVLQFMSYRSSQASEALNGALEAFEAPIGEPSEDGKLSFPDEAARTARSKELFEEVRKEYGGTSAGAVSMIYLARMAADEGDLATARKLWESYVDRRGEDLVAAQLRLNLLDLEREEEGGREAVATKLQAMLDKGDRSLPEDVLLYQLAVTLEDLSRTEEALTYYQRIIDEFPQSQFSGPARQKSASLGASPSVAVG
jgi:tetratricopeptide (TPR) repeat protein